MGKDKVEKSDKKSKKEKRSDVDGIKKSKKEKKSKLNQANVTAALEEVSKSLEPATAPIALEKDTDYNIEQDAPPLKVEVSLVPFANPLADEKITKKVLRSVKKASKNKTLKRGVKEVVKALRKSPQGIGITSANCVVILAADISPMDVISHIPILCEDHNIPYIFVTSRAELGSASNTKRPTSVVMVTETRVGSKKTEVIEGSEEFGEVFKQLIKIVEKESRNVRI
ncbi:H/ACA ribonucleoprotein complex subunit 2 [Golovinomyces cichoracearum]|uniref:H/ACA ribonucleoprotein complex subunit 2 n=1 Tax=Golovinomyces cichoracearum TaxID=62708 RepID=A0A420I7Q5_9PEZI|nr:H/ACA ribonucleoprotein complex subunit 2 [Golovinomyces cichoracearum]